MSTLFTRQSETDSYEEVGPDNPLAISVVPQAAAGGVSYSVPLVVAVASMVSLASTAASQTLLGSNAARSGLLLNNTDANAVLLKYGATASSSSYTVRIPANGYWEMPSPIYSGRIDVIWEADGSGSLIGSEL